ncbi:hypothetical protein B0T14DRAFT_563371 [Immersiella caudata]|uniref:Uncharacterized protein n=1 Tax=Immersiella caudata TaxID=314043 RepID=A0AA39X5M1_9PEZI|nr:hypothetical protein B0T14DRAFT_563371 [Immersiella caudata]
MDRPLTKAQFHRATWLAAGFFSESIAAELRQKPCPPHGYHDPTIIDAILSSAHMETFQDLSLRQCCRSVKKFLRAVGEVFSNEILDHFPERAKHFDKISGVRGLSDAFMEQKSAQEFVLDIVDAISDVVSELAREELPASPAPSITPTPSTFEEPLEDPRCQVVEIQLEGPTIRDAWDANAKTRHLEKPATLAAGLTPKDTEFQSLPAFHGTGPLRGLNQEDKLAERLGYIFTGGGHRHQQTQVAPTYDCLPVVSTTFSPLRAFLWAVFYSTVIQSVPIAGYEARGEKPWECLGHAHAGATVCEFRPSIVASKDPYQTVYSIPEGRESAWYQVVQHLDALPKAKLTTLPTPSLLWEQFSQLHGGAGKGWPNIIHCKEFGAVRKTLSSCVQQPWRSVWTDISIDLLNKSHVQTYSITFKQKDRTSPPPVPGFKMRIGV